MIRPAVAGLALLLALVSVQAAERLYTVSAEEWARPRQGDLLVTYPGLNEAIQEWNQHQSGRIQIRHPSGEEGILWAEELRDWLVALGVPSNLIETVPGGLGAANIDLVFMLREDIKP